MVLVPNRNDQTIDSDLSDLDMMFKGKVSGIQMHLRTQNGDSGVVNVLVNPRWERPKHGMPYSKDPHGPTCGCEFWWVPDLLDIRIRPCPPTTFKVGSNSETKIVNIADLWFLLRDFEV